MTRFPTYNFITRFPTYNDSMYQLVTLTLIFFLCSINLSRSECVVLSKILMLLKKRLQSKISAHYSLEYQTRRIKKNNNQPNEKLNCAIEVKSHYVACDKEKCIEQAKNRKRYFCKVFIDDLNTGTNRCCYYRSV